jgi:ankyrin repeat protein
MAAEAGSNPDLTAPGTPSNPISNNSQLTPPSSGSHSVSTSVPAEWFASSDSQQGHPAPRSEIEDSLRVPDRDHPGATRKRRSLSCKYAISFHNLYPVSPNTDLDSRSYVYLGYLRILYETICSCSAAINPRGFVLRYGQEVNGRLASMAGNVVQEYKSVLWKFIAQNDDEEHIRIKNRLLEAMEAIRSMNEIAAKEMFSEPKMEIYERLINIYKAECNEPEVERYMILLEELSNSERTHHDTDGTIASQIAHSMKRTSQELVTVTEEISKNLESPLLESPWLYKSTTPFPSLHRALRAGLDKVSEILAKEEKGLADCDFLKRMAIQVAAECGSTTFLEENLRDRPHLRKHGDVLHHTPVFDAAAHGNLETFQSLVREDHKLIFVRDIDGATLMDVLAAGGYTDFARYLLSLGFDVKQPAIAAASPLHTAVQRGYIKFCELLLDAEVDAGGMFPGPDGSHSTAAQAAYHKSCEATESKIKEEFYSLALRIARVEGPPYTSWKWMEHQRGEAKGSIAGQAATIRSLDPSPFPSDYTIHPIGRTGSEAPASINRFNHAGHTPGFLG